MSQKEKLLKKFLARPESLRCVELICILLDLGFQHIPAKGSHQKFKHPHIVYDLVISIHNHKCKDIYKRKALNFIKTHFSL